MDNELSLIRFNVINFFSVILNSRPFQPISTLLIKLVEALISSEPEPNEEITERLKWIYENTHLKVNENLSIIELAVFKNLDRGLNREIEIGSKTFNLTSLYKYLDEVAKELTTIVIEIAKKYSIDIPIMSSQTKNQNIQNIGLE
jgi:hypothetical protein